VLCRPQNYRASNPQHSVLHEAVTVGWPQVQREASDEGTHFPQRVYDEMQGYLNCGDARHGFVEVRCEECETSVAVPFSCKRRGFCPKCAAKRAHETEEHLMGLLPSVSYRQWTLTLPSSLRWPVVKDVTLLRSVEKRLLRAIFRWQRQKMKALGMKGKAFTGAVSQLQLFSSALALQPHWHVLVPEGVWLNQTFVELPAPDIRDVEAVLMRLLKTVERLFLKEEESQDFPHDALERLQHEGAQLKFGWPAVPTLKGHLTAIGGGFSLHAGTWVHANDRQNLARLVGYGARGPISEVRLSRTDDGNYQYLTKRGLTLTLTAADLVRRLVWLTPPRRLHLTNFHGVFSSHSKARALITQKPQASDDEAPRLTKDQTRRARRTHLDFATLLKRTFGIDIWTCECGGKRRVLAIITTRRLAAQRLGDLGLEQAHPHRPPKPMAQAPPQLALAV